MRVLLPALVVLAALAVSGCGNNRFKEGWDGARDAINRPFR